MLQIVKASVPGAALTEARLRDERLFPHGMDKSVPAQRPLRGKAELKAALRRVQNVLPHGAVDKLRRGEDEDAAAAPQRWLQTQYAFPVRVPVYVRAAERLLCRDGDLACGTFLGPSDPEQEPYIRLAVGDYLPLLAAWGQDSALASILRSLAHELTHYFQWVRDPVGYQTADESRLERQADRCARETLYDYADVYAHP